MVVAGSSTPHRRSLTKVPVIGAANVGMDLALLQMLDQQQQQHLAANVVAFGTILYSSRINLGVNAQVQVHEEAAATNLKEGQNIIHQTGHPPTRVHCAFGHLGIRCQWQGHTGKRVLLAEEFTEGPNTRQKVAQESLGKPLLPDLSLEHHMGQPMVQTELGCSGTCALAASAMCLEAVHRMEYEKVHGVGTFPLRAAPPTALFEECRKEGTWNPDVGAEVGDVLDKIRAKGGIAATTTNAAAPPCSLSLRSWEEHRWDDADAGGLSAERVADLLRHKGPCIGVVWAISPSYDDVNAGRDDNLVYTTDEYEYDHQFLPNQAGWHTVVCFGYRFRDGQKHVLVLDNHDETGPRRWIHVEEFHTLYTLDVWPQLDLGEQMATSPTR